MKKLLLSLLAVILIIEEWLWDILTALGRHLARLLHLVRFERWLSQAPPKVAVVALAVPMGIVTPINLAAFWLLAHGLILQGVLVEILAKLLGTLLIARIFALTKTQLLTFGWFAWIYTTITGWLRWAHERISGTAVYRMAQHLKERVKARVSAWRKTLD